MSNVTLFFFIILSLGFQTLMLWSPLIYKTAKSLSRIVLSCYATFSSFSKAILAWDKSESCWEINPENCSVVRRVWCDVWLKYIRVIWTITLCQHCENNNRRTHNLRGKKSFHCQFQKPMKCVLLCKSDDRYLRKTSPVAQGRIFKVGRFLTRRLGQKLLDDPSPDETLPKDRASSGEVDSYRTKTAYSLLSRTYLSYTYLTGSQDRTTICQYIENVPIHPVLL